MLKKYMFILSIVILVIIFRLLYMGNNLITVTKYNIKLSKLPDAFIGYKMVHLSDVHSKKFGKEQYKLVNKIKKQNPDIIVITGDLVDRRRYSSKGNVMELLEKIVDIAPVYFVAGNHEWWSKKYKSEIYDEIQSYGVNILDDEKVDIKIGEDKINLIGINDPAKYYREKAKVCERYIGSVLIDRILNKFNSNINDKEVKILLSHRPELIDIYKLNKMDLVLSGHVHGGQIKIPFVGGILSPNQGIFPKYDGGIYKEDDTTLIISRGLGNSLFPFRINNLPEIVVITMKKIKT